MKAPRRVALVLVAVVPAALLVSACGGGTDTSAAKTAAALQTTAPTTAAPTATPAVPAEVQLTDDDNGRSLTLAKGGTLIIALVSNPSTGFAWSVADPSPAQLVLQGEPQYVPPGSTTPVVGAAGTQVFTFKATATGEAKLTLNYARSFEPTVPPEKTFTVTVTVQ
jgi:inhibitor of cysteine peptidase